MFHIAVQSGGPEELLGVPGAYKAIKEAGFDGVDANIDHLLTWNDIAQRKLSPAFQAEGKAALEYFKPWKEAAEACGLENYQAHAPFPSYVQGEDGAFNEAMIHVLKTCLMGCDYMNCRRLIIHPFFLGYDAQMTPEREWEVNIERYSQLIPAAKEYGVTICLENMFSGHNHKIYSACCSDITTACAYIDELNRLAGQKCFGFCLDTGHLLLLGKDIKNSMIQLGDRIEAFHVHDNNGLDDQHLAPYMGVMDWSRFVEGLAAIHYDKTMSFETFNVFNVMHPEIAVQMLSVIAKTGRLFDRLASESVR